MSTPPVAAASAVYTIGELAREFDLTTRAIRFYEDSGLIAPQRGGAGGRQRVYSARDRTRLKLTLRGDQARVLVEADRTGREVELARELADRVDR